VLDALEFFRIAQHIAIGKRNIGVTATIANGVHSIVNANNGDSATINSELANFA
jgi:hypothetical protein